MPIRWDRARRDTVETLSNIKDELEEMCMFKSIKISIAGMGIIMHSKQSVAHIKEGEDYFSEHYNHPVDVVEHIKSGTIVGFCTSSRGDYILNLHEGYPCKLELSQAKYKLRLIIEVTDEHIYFNDLFALMDWSKEYCNNISVKLDNGYYHITLLGNDSESGILGDEQLIDIYFNKCDELPLIACEGVPIYS